MAQNAQFDLEATDKTKMKFNLKEENNTLSINVDLPDTKNVKYEGEFTKENLNNASKVFKMDDTLTANFPIIKWFFEQKKVTANKQNDTLDLTFSPNVLYLQDFHLTLKKITILNQVEKMSNKILGKDLGGKVSKGIGGLKKIFGK